MMEDHSDSLASDKKSYVKSMFDSIAWRYDFLNHFLSAGIDKLWRKKAIKIISGHNSHSTILDVATGTGDLAIAAVKIDPESITGIDISPKMLEIGKEKISRLGLSGKIRLMQGDSENMPFPDNTFDVAMVAFGVRNFADPLKGLMEMSRVLKTGGMVLVLEFSRPRTFPFKNVYPFYFRRILPLFGRLFSGSKS
ncbi:MAG: ubiquinone/menaquinone biosynthesis methyltransferase, partial [Chloroflexota bacterium]